MKKRAGNKSLLISSKAYNELVDAVDWVQTERGRSQPVVRTVPQNQAWIWCLNKTGQQIVAGSLVGLSQPIILPSQNLVAFQHQIGHEVVVPNATTHASRFGVALVGVPNLAFFSCLVAGVASVKINVQAGHIGAWSGRASLVNGSIANLISDPVGLINVLWCSSAAAGNTVPTTSGLQDARILLPAGGTGGTTQLLPRYGRITADLNHNLTANVQLLEGAVGSETVPGSPQTVVGHNLLYRRLWQGSNVSLAPHDVTGGTPSTYRITWSNSASDIRGTLATAVSPGATGTLNSPVGIDGVFPYSTATVHNVLLNYTVGPVRAFAKWNQTTSAWEIYSADCAT